MPRLEEIPSELLEGILVEAAKDDILSRNTIPFFSHLWKRLISQHPPQKFKWYKRTWSQQGYNLAVVLEAALQGHFEVLKWLKENGCPFNKSVCTAAAEGHLEILVVER